MNTTYDMTNYRAVISTEGNVLGFLKTDEQSIILAGAVLLDGSPMNWRELKTSNAKKYKTVSNWENTIETDFVKHTDPRDGSTFYTIADEYES